MRFYINILATYFPDIDPPYKVYYEQILEQVALAEELGWECFMFNEHHFLGYGGPIANPAVLLAAAAARTSKIHLGPCIAILPLRHPLHSAEDYAMVDAISGGRLEFGIGSGNTEMDYKVFGVTRENDRQRLHEALEIVLKAWGQDHASHRGEFWRFDELTLYPRPMQQPHPPIWVAGTSAEGLGWAGRQGYHIMTVGHPHPPEKVCLGVEAWKRGLIEAGFDPSNKHCQFHVRTHVHEDSEQAKLTGMAAVKRYDEISRIGRRSLSRGARRIRLGDDACHRAEQLRQSGTVHSEYPQRDEELLFRYADDHFQFRRYPARRDHEVHAFVRQRSHAGVSLETHKSFPIR